MSSVLLALGCVVAFGLWVGLALWRLSRVFRSESRIERGLFSGLTLGCALVTAALLVYFVFPFTALSVGLMFAALTLLIAILPIYAPAPTGSIEIPGSEEGGDTPWHALVVLVITQGSLLALLCAGRTSEPLVSPWLLFPGSVFGLFFLAMALCAYVCSRLGYKALPFASLQTFLAVGVSAVVYGIGFGFDPFIHRAAETALVNFGEIEPTSLLYSGQYALVGLLHFVTRLPVAMLDIWLLPVLTSVCLPLAAYVGLRRGWGVSEKIASMGWLTALFVPFMLFTFTVPFTVTYVWFAASLYLFPLTKSWGWWMLLCWCGLLGVFFHPLLGVPIGLLIFFAGCFYRAEARWAKSLVLTVFVLALAGGVPLLMWLYQQQAGSEVNLNGLWENYAMFLSLFVNPFNNYHSSIRWEYHLLYWWRYWQPVALTLIAFPLALGQLVKYRPHVLILVSMAAGLMCCMYVISTLFVFKGIINHEQHEFALRLLQSFYILPIPLIAVGLERVQASAVLRWVCLLGLSAAVTAAWYFSYPQFNAKFAYYSPSVSSYDVEAVQRIELDSQNRPYLALSNQMTSAAALQEFGFSHYYTLEGEEVLWYAIPTGGKLYDYYLKIIYGNSPDLLQGLMQETNTSYVYVVMPTYWSWNSDMLRQLEVQSTQRIFIDGKIIIYRFDRYADADQN